MELTRIRALRGPNIWGKHTAIEALVYCEPNERALDNLQGFETRLRSRFPQLGPISNTQNEPVSLAHVLEVCTRDLQAQAGCPVAFSRTMSTPDDGVYIVVVEYTEEKVGRLALDLAIKLCQSALIDNGSHLEEYISQLQELDEDIRLGPSTASIVDAAIARGIPYQRLTEGSLVQLGWGSKQRRIQAAETSETSAIAESIAQDKDLTKRLLNAAGVPVPMGKIVTTADEAWETYLELKVPVAIKPRDGNQGKGVAVNISTREQIDIAFAAASKISSEVIVERYLPGQDHRFLVIGNQLVAAARREPPYVTGDGVHTVRELVEEVNKDPLRGDGHATSLSKIRIDEIAISTLKNQDLSPESVPAKGLRVTLRNNANLSTGGTATDVTEDVHPDLAASAIAAAQMVGLDICGVDVVCENVFKPLEEQGGGIVEVNAAPGLRMHLHPSYGKGRPVGEAIISTMFGPGEDGRIPTVAVTGTNGKTTTVRMIAHIFKEQGLRVGFTGTDGVYVNGRRIDTGDCSGPKSARNVLMHPDVDAAVLETARGGILREGLGFDRCHVAVVTNIGEGDHLGMNYINTAAEIANVKRVIVQNVAPSGMAVLNAADPLVAKMAKVCPGQVTYFARDVQHPIMAKHRAQGQRVIFVQDQHIIAAEGKKEFHIPLSSIPITANGMISFQVENTMAVIGAAWALNISWDVISQALSSFVSDANNVPGRFNLFTYRQATIIADYGHNPDAIAALSETISQMPAKKRMVVISGAGDRRDQDIRKQTEILGQHFDHVILYEDQCQRGRADGEVVAILRQGLSDSKIVKKIEEIQGEFKAIDSAFSQIEAGDVCLVLVDQVEEALAHIQSKISS
ncbi:cyanophycin synthetase [Polynucleobacter sp. MWH-Loch1C5]|uniref:cyanophycin synthetase n=1 Tax=Polynucleobacter sp. MWH-Loch1C5 TaxID=2689108 RepID=UPI001C0DED59|nr:cyanophycin synthetase [Polynucleobacter sp. MWH-Loch1C5]MBU3542066.1 cyanophycin synthetase [Polynucleobacter sp. MWH-Loch1C5]